MTVSEKNKRYLEKLRKIIPSDKVPSIKKTVGLVLDFVGEREVEFLNWIKEKKRGETR